MSELQNDRPHVDPLAWAFKVAAMLPEDDDEAKLALGYLIEMVERYRLGEAGGRPGLVEANKMALTVWLNPLVSPK